VFEIASSASIAWYLSWRMTWPAWYLSRYFAVSVVIQRSLRLAHVRVNSSTGGVTGFFSSAPSAM
jgi:hypothetical protein